MSGIEKTAQGWRLSVDGMILDIDGTSGSLNRLVITADQEFLWTDKPGAVSVRDDFLEHTFGPKDLQQARIEPTDNGLIIRKSFKGAPWLLTEKYTLDGDAIAWAAEVTLDKGDFRSCAVSMSIPWPTGQMFGHYGMEFWAAKDNMPSAPHRFAGISLEYGEITSGITMPALCCYRADEKAGLMLTMPFDFRTPRFSFNSAYREPDLETRFDWLALGPGKPARTSLLMHGTGGSWRPALGWLYGRFKEYFEPRSTLIDSLWGGHTSGWSDVPAEEAHAMKELGMTWQEMHMHFPAYGNYHPEGVDAWPIGHWLVDPRPDGDERAKALITVDIMRRTIKNLHSEGIAALPYIQVSGDGDDERVAPLFESSMARDRNGKTINTYFGCHQMNSDPSLPFGQDMIRQIRGMVARFPEMDGVFVDQLCYNYLDTAHDDGVTAVNNRPAYMTGFNYLPHLELLSSLLHPSKVIIGNGPQSIGVMKHVDAYMAEGEGWLCDHLQYYSLAKPMFFLSYAGGEQAVETMFQQCLIHGAGFTSTASALPHKNIYDLYMPLLQRLYRRRWLFDPNPITLPHGFSGSLFQSPSGSLVSGMVSKFHAHTGAASAPQTVNIESQSAIGTTKVTLRELGKEPTSIPFSIDGGKVQFDIPGNAVALVAELEK